MRRTRNVKSILHTALNQVHDEWTFSHIEQRRFLRRYCNPPWGTIPRVFKILEQGKKYQVMLVVPMHPHRPRWHQLRKIGSLQYPLYKVVFQLPDSMTINARHPMVFAWL